MKHHRPIPAQSALAALAGIVLTAAADAGATFTWSQTAGGAQN